MTTVWLGVWVVVFFNLRFGWVLSGLVVPGYLVPLLLVKPWSAGVVVFEGTLTYLLVWLYSEKISKFSGITNFFGRDRFFALLLASVLVRVICDTFVFPAIGEYVNSSFNLHFDYRNNLHSFGLIVIALIANQFWKPGLQRGFIVLAVTVFITFLLVRYVVMPFTNFSIGNLAYMYEDLAASMLAGPKAYIVLLTTAFIASHFNLKYGWEFSGILIPALLALEWYQPAKLLVTFLETFIILSVASQLLKARIFQRTTIEGARKLFFFFNVSFFYKLLLGHIIVVFLPMYHISDFYGFGYLLSTLLAIKMHDKELAAVITRASLQTSLFSLVVATLIGFGLGFVPNFYSISDIDTSTGDVTTYTQTRRTLRDFIQKEQVLIHKTVSRNSVPVPLPEEIDVFREALRLLQNSIEAQDQQSRRRAFNLLGRLQYTVHKIEGKFLVLSEQEPKRGWGMYILNLNTKNKLQVQIPDPLGEWGTNYAGLSMFTAFNCNSMAIGGSKRKANDDGSADVLTTNNSFFYIFQQIFGIHEVIQLRALTEKNRPRILANSSLVNTLDKDITSLLMVNTSLPEGLPLADVKADIGDFEVLWDPPPAKNVLRNSGQGSFSEFFLTRKDRQTLLFKRVLPTESLSSTESIVTIIDSLEGWFFKHKDTLADKGSGLYIPPTLEELLFWDKELLTPLLRFLQSSKIREQWSANDWNEARVLKNTAQILGYDLIHFKHKISGSEYLILAEHEKQPQLKYWGTYIFRLGGSENYLVQVPRPLFEKNVFEYGISLFGNLHAKSLFVSGAHLQTNEDGSADLLKTENKGTFFNLANQVVLRESDRQEMLIVQCRAFANIEGSDVPDALIATHSGVGKKSVSPLLEKLVQVLQSQYHFSVKKFSGLASETGYEVKRIPQVQYLDQTENRELINLWLSPTARKAYRQQEDNRPLISHFSALKIASISENLYTFLIEQRTPVLPGSAAIDISRLQDHIADYIHSYDILALQNLIGQWPTLTFNLIIDTSSKQAFLVAMTKTGQPLLVANLHPLKENPIYHLTPSFTKSDMNRYIDSRAMWLTTKDSL